MNLLPWRDENRRIKNQHFYFIHVVLSVLCSFLMLSIYFTIKYHTQVESNNIYFLENELKKMEIEKAMIEVFQKDKIVLLNRMDMVQKLQSERLKVAKLIDRLPRVVPDGVCIISLVRKDDRVHLEGYANTNAAISNLLKNLESNEMKDFFQDIKLKEILLNKREEELRFKIQFCLNLVEDSESNENTRN